METVKQLLREQTRTPQGRTESGTKMQRSTVHPSEAKSSVMYSNLDGPLYEATLYKIIYLRHNRKMLDEST